MSGLFISLVLSYLIGSMPTSYIAARFLKKIDIRRHGSGNAGATNVFRVVGKIPGIIVLVIDMLKGSFAVYFLPAVFFNNSIGLKMGLELYEILLGIAVISGHVWSIFLKFKGGKGIATTAGALLVIAPKLLLGCAVTWGIVFGIFRIVSVASIAASLALPLFAVIFYGSFYLVLTAVVLCAASVYKHKSNIRRLLRGEEKKLV